MNAVPLMYSWPLFHTRSPIRRPMFRALKSPSSKWIPPYRRDHPASSAASLNVGHESVIGVAGVMAGSARLVPIAMVTECPNESDPVNRFRISALAALNVLCPELYSANGGVMKESGWNGFQF